jgi:serine/threonine protein kinase
VPASLAPSSRDVSVCSLPERFRLLRELGSRAVPTWAALEQRPDGRTQLVIVERATRKANTDADLAAWARTAEHLAKVVHPNLPRVRDVVRRPDDVIVASDFVDGVTWAKLTACPRSPPLETALRVLVEVLSGLGALHAFRGSGQPLNLIHGALTPDAIVVGVDGTTRILNVCPLRSAEERPGRASAYLAPEVLLADDSADARADVYSVGAMLWEVLSGQPLFPNLQPSAIVTHILSGRPGPPTVRATSAWAQPLADVAARAMAADPQKRFSSASAFAAELRRVAGLKMMSPSKVAAWMEEVHGDVVRLRREALERGGARSVDVSGIAPQSETKHDDGSIDVIIDRPSTAPTPMLPVAPPARYELHESQVQPVATRRPPPAQRAHVRAPPRVGDVLSAPRAEAEQGPPEIREFEREVASTPFESLIVPQAPLVPKDLEHVLPPPWQEPRPPAKWASPRPPPVREAPDASALPPVSSASQHGLRPRHTALTVALVVAGGLALLWILWPSDNSLMGKPHAATGLVSSTEPAHGASASTSPSVAASSLAVVVEVPANLPESSAAAPEEVPRPAAGPAQPRPARQRPAPAKKYEPEGI